ncbi:major facilitator superfamily domain-containing protein 6-like [Pogonomyrmex barbatus]|uniref:Major facilitator superfamily domain-containing protein 6-like n=1 Tax=Pogonomyrmex barbatus TaxID=144034 RepID=A0A6I9WFZ8_9HYME|nr:major facilitator superfamily domain-containing protein 6-like [Pogonomyrmex barbatus]
MKVNNKLLPIKLHYFFFLASLGCTFPFLHVYGKQLGLSPLVIGSISAIVPLLYLITKPIFGFIMDYSRAWRKTICIIFIVMTNSCFVGIFFLPAMPGPVLTDHFENVSYPFLSLCDIEHDHTSAIESDNSVKDITCYWLCKDTNFSTRLFFRNATERKTIISLDTACLINVNDTSFHHENITANYNCNVTCDNFENNYCIWTSITFWSYMLLLFLGETGYFVVMIINDATCFAILSENKRLKYGEQRLWGTIAFGITGCIVGYMVNLSQREAYKTFTPVLYLILVLTGIDLVCCKSLKMSFESGSSTIIKDVFALLKLKSVVIFLFFAVFTGIINSFMHNFLFWYLEDFADATGYMSKIKLIEGLIVGVQNFGETVSFFLSGKIVKKIGYGHTFTLCFICYALRLGLISLVPTPWWILPIEFFMHGLSFSLCLATIVSYASVITPPGASATVQAIVQSMHDSFGVSIGALLGGIFYKKYGGTTTLRIFSVFAAFDALTYFILYIIYLRNKTYTRSNVKWKKPDDAQEYCMGAEG